MENNPVKNKQSKIRQERRKNKLEVKNYLYRSDSHFSLVTNNQQSFTFRFWSGNTFLNHFLACTPVTHFILAEHHSLVCLLRVTNEMRRSTVSWQNAYNDLKNCPRMVCTALLCTIVFLSGSEWVEKNSHAKTGFCATDTVCIHLHLRSCMPQIQHKHENPSGYTTCNWEITKNRWHNVKESEVWSLAGPEY